MIGRSSATSDSKSREAQSGVPTRWSSWLRAPSHDACLQPGPGLKTEGPRVLEEVGRLRSTKRRDSRDRRMLIQSLPLSRESRSGVLHIASRKIREFFPVHSRRSRPSAIASPRLRELRLSVRLVVGAGLREVALPANESSADRLRLVAVEGVDRLDLAAPRAAVVVFKAPCPALVTTIFHSRGEGFCWLGRSFTPTRFTMLTRPPG